MIAPGIGELTVLTMVIGRIMELGSQLLNDRPPVPQWGPIAESLE